MTLDTSPLFRPLTIRNKTLRNRIVMPPMVVNRGTTTPEGIAWYGERARGGVGLVIVEATSVPDVGESITAEGLKPLVDTIHDGGALAAIQLFPGHRVGPNKAGDPADTDVRTLVGQYERAALVCREAGFDGVEPHGAHGYTLNQFFSPERNTRADAYGPQSLENRSRLALQIVWSIRRLIDDMLLLYRHTPVGAGYGIDDSLFLAEQLANGGVDILDLSPSSIDAPGDHAAPFKGLGLPLITVNELDRVESAVEVMTEERADLVAVGKGLIADPLWPQKVREGRFDEIVACIRCDGCGADQKAGRPVSCTQW